MFYLFNIVLFIIFVFLFAYAEAITLYIYHTIRQDVWHRYAYENIINICITTIETFVNVCFKRNEQSRVIAHVYNKYWHLFFGTAVCLSPCINY